MNRKIDRQIKEQWPCYSESGELVRSVTPGQHGTSRVTFGVKAVSDVSETVLDPSVVTLTRLIESGQVIDPSSLMNSLQLQDAADVDQFKKARANKLYAYVKEHKDEIKELLAKESQVVEPQN